MNTYHNIDPIIFSFSFGGFELALRWYALSYIAGLLFAWKFMQFLVKKNDLWLNRLPPLNKVQVEELMTYMILGVIVGGRLGYVFFYKPGYYIENPTEILMVWNGGMSFHGGFLGVVIGGIYYSTKNSFDLVSTGDLIAVASPPGIFFGRLANFINGELWGKPTVSDWGVIFPSQEAQDCPAEWVGVCARHPSQLYEAFLEGFVLWLLMLTFVFFFRSFKRRGETTCIFLIGYGISRLIVEIFREADLQFISESNPNGYVILFTENLGVSMGQLLSLPMIVAGIIGLIYIRAIMFKRSQ